MTPKEYLEQYTALNTEIKQIEHDLGELSSQPTHLATDCVLGSPDEEPFQNIPIPIHGYVQSEETRKARKRLVEHYDRQLEQLYHGREAAESIIARMEDPKARTIIRYRYIDGLEWNDIAAKMGFEVTKDGARMYAERALKKLS